MGSRHKLVAYAHTNDARHNIHIYIRIGQLIEDHGMVYRRFCFQPSFLSTTRKVRLYDTLSSCFTRDGLQLGELRNLHWVAKLIEDGDIIQYDTRGFMGGTFDRYGSGLGCILWGGKAVEHWRF
jgi:hypothetical protein